MKDDQPEDLAINFEEMREKAIKKGWRQPRAGGNRGDMTAWINYWSQLEEHDKKVEGGDTNPGRPIIPHRSA